LTEQLGDGVFKYHLSTMPANTTLEELVRLEHQRWTTEQAYQQLNEELGSGRFEGRSWRGLHYYLTLRLQAFCFLARLRTSRKAPLTA